MSDNSQELSPHEAKLNELEELRKYLPPEVYNTRKAALLTQINATQNIGLQISGGEPKVEGDLVAGDNIKAEQVIKVQGDLHQTITRKDEEAENTVEKARRNYLRDLRQQCQYLPLIDIAEEGDPEAKLSLNDIYIDLNTTTPVPLTDEEKKTGKEKRAPQFSERGEQDTRLLTIKEAAEKESRLVILGDPGAGKSSFVNELLSRLALAHLGKENDLPPIFNNLFPVFVRLRDFAKHLEGLKAPQNKQPQAFSDALCAYIASGLNQDSQKFAPELQKVIRDGACLLVFDGLDEVPHAQRGAVRAAVSMVVDYLKIHRAIVTCRKLSYGEDSRLRSFVDHTLDSLDDPQIRGFAKRWYDAQKNFLKGKDPEAQAEDLASAALELRELACNPLLLTTMALIHQRDAKLPDQRVKLYRSAVDLLLRRWQKSKDAAIADFLSDEKLMLKAMRRLAYEAHRASKDKEHAADLPRHKVIEILEKPEYLGSLARTEQFLDYVDQRAGLMIGRGGAQGQPDVYSFPHRTFQEYLAGCHILSLRDSVERAREVLDRAADGVDWQLAITLAAEELRHNRDDGENDLRDLMYMVLVEIGQGRTEKFSRAALWASEMALLAGRTAIENDKDQRIGGKPFLKKLQKLLLAILTGDLTPPERAAAGVALAKLELDDRDEILTVDAMPFCFIPSGKFLMGSNEETDNQSYEDERDQHEVELPAYLISRYPISNAQYDEFVKAEGYKNREYWAEAISVEFWSAEGFKGRYDSVPRSAPYTFGEPFNLRNHPVVGVTWYEALAFTCWLTDNLQNKKLLPPKWRVTLPSEAQWEKAARGGLQIPSKTSLTSLSAKFKMTQPALKANKKPNRIYPWGDEFKTDYANTSESGIGTTSALGCFSNGESPYGVLELSGNVWEWTQSNFEKYPYDLNDGREDTTASPDVRRVLRGGSYVGGGRLARCAFRYGDSPSDWYDDRGFRVVAFPFFDNSDL